MLPTWDHLVAQEDMDIRKVGIAGLGHALCEALMLPQIIDQQVVWDERQAKLSPGTLCKALVLNIFAHRTPLYHISESFEKHETTLYFGEGVRTDDLTDDRFGWFLDRFAAANPAGIFMQVALSALTLHHRMMNGLHSDTTSVSVEGEYSGTEERPNELIARGYSKDHRADLKQIMMGLVTQEDGLPVMGHVLPGNTSDRNWNGDVIESLATFLTTEQCRQTTYIADSAMVTGDNVRTLADAKLNFISRLPGTYGICGQVIEQAWSQDEWNDIGKLAQRPDALILREYKEQWRAKIAFAS
ncbi:IS1634 family transposase [Heliophilum fasciatum]|nr:IS1634 family transposase [Heliophilum fasciatum]MCW2279438.1 transposase [Heliophilum fasciatum]